MVGVGCRNAYLSLIPTRNFAFVNQQSSAAAVLQQDHDSPLRLCRQDLGGLEDAVGPPQLTMRWGLRSADHLCMVSPATFQGAVPSDIFEPLVNARCRRWEDAPPLLGGQQKIWYALPCNCDSLCNCDRLGSLARIGPNTLVTDDPALMRKMNAVRSPYRRSDWYIGMRFDPSRDNVLVANG